jgi:virginiamycin B lyase
MSQRQQYSQLHLTDKETVDVQRAQRVIAHTHQRSLSRLSPRRLWFLSGMTALLCIITLVALAHENSVGLKQASPVRQTTIPELTAIGTFREYSFPRPDSQVMRPAIDHQGRLWFGAMGQNALVVFDPRTGTYHYLTPPHGHHGIMGVQVAPDDTIWFAEQFANYLGHYFPVTGRYQLYPLPRLIVPDPGRAGHTLSLPSAPNELALDMHGDVWFTEFNADRLGWLDPRIGRMRHYPLSIKMSVQTLYPYGVTVDPQGIVWFTESGTNQLGRLDPTTGALQLFAVPDSHALLMEIASDRQGTLWVTAFSPGLLFRFKPATKTFIVYTAPLSGSERSPLYGLLVTRSGGVWVTILAESVIARLDVATGRFIYYRIPTPGSLPLGITMDARQDVWFTGNDEIGMLRPERS